VGQNPAKLIERTRSRRLDCRQRRIYNADVDTDNPYASPLAPSRLPTAESDVPSAWRDGELLIARRRGGVLPKACIKSNSQAHVISYSITTLTNRSAAVVLSLFLIPFIGLLLGCLVVVALLRSQRAGNTTIWLRPLIALRFWAYDLATVLLVLSGNLLSGGGILEGEPMTIAAGLLCTLLGIAVSALPFQVLEFLKLELKPRDLVCIHGASSDYLDRLPPWNEPQSVPAENPEGIAIAG
jgi:hypothetical protein